MDVSMDYHWAQKADQHDCRTDLPHEFIDNVVVWFGTRLIRSCVAAAGEHSEQSEWATDIHHWNVWTLDEKLCNIWYREYSVCNCARSLEEV